MKLKILLFAVFAAGIGASYALADNGGQHDGNACRNVHLHGTIAPQTLTVTSDGKGEHSTFPAGSQVVLTVGATGQTVRVNVEACSTTTGTVTQVSVRSLELRVVKPKPAATTDTAGGTTTGKHGDDEHHQGATTTAATTTAATTTAATTTAATTTSH